LYGTKEGSDDSDGDGISDLEEILDYGTDPAVKDELNFDLRIVNWKDGDISGVGKLFVRGVANKGLDVKVFADKSEDGTSVFIGDLTIVDDNKFAVMSDVDLEDGEYLLYARGFSERGVLMQESFKIRIIIDKTKYVESPVVRSIGNVPILSGVQIVISDQQPVVFGSSTPNSQVFITFESQIFSSTVVSDGMSGFFTLFAPKPLPVGEHKMTVYAVSEDGVKSDVVELSFEVTAKKVRVLWGISFAWIVVLILLLLIVAYFAYRYLKNRDKKKRMEDELRDKKAEEEEKKRMEDSDETLKILK